MSDGDAVPGQVTDILEAVQVVLKRALVRDGVVRGLRECTKALDRKEAHLALLAADCEEAAYRKLIVALCKQNGINLLEVPTRTELGQWSGLFKQDKDNQPRKIVPTSVVVIRNFGEQTPELEFILNHFKTSK